MPVPGKTFFRSSAYLLWHCWDRPEIPSILDVPIWKLFTEPGEVIETPQVIAQFYFKGNSYFATSMIEIKSLIAKFEESLENQMENP